MLSIYRLWPIHNIGIYGLWAIHNVLSLRKEGKKNKGCKRYYMAIWLLQVLTSPKISFRMLNIFELWAIHKVLSLRKEEKNNQGCKSWAHKGLIFDPAFVFTCGTHTQAQVHANLAGEFAPPVRERTSWLHMINPFKRRTI